MNANRYLVASIAAVLGFGGYLAYAGGTSDVRPLDQQMEKAAAKDIVDIAAGVPELSTLVTAVKAAGLVETLKGDGPFTVFAPTNEAFAKLPAGTLETLLKPENKEQLKKVLLYHVHVGAGVKAADVKTMKLSTAAGQDLDIKVADGGVTVDNAKVIKTDVVAKNGVVHVIDTVVLPK